jgi:caffeoyl-CoA O-methyltransferase
MDFVPKTIQAYCEAHTTVETELLSKINRETHVEVLKPRMLSGHLQGRFLSMISHMIRPDRILEIGTFTGYSALCLAEGLSKNGKLTTIEYNEELIPRISKNFSQSKFNQQLNLIHGNAKEIIPDLNETWNLVFVDADKESYKTYFELTIPKVTTGGFLLFDNTLWSGKVADTTISDRKTEMIRELNRSILEDPRVENLLMPFRDGLTILRKI